ncbi:unnamed protein product [Merluccius merluccius]
MGPRHSQEPSWISGVNKISDGRHWACAYGRNGSSFKALQIPEAADTQTSAINAQEVESNKMAFAYIEESKARITQYEEQLAKFNNMIPFDQMTVEDLNDTFPETTLDKVKHPYWPHKPIADL